MENSVCFVVNSEIVNVCFFICALVYDHPFCIELFLVCCSLPSRSLPMITASGQWMSRKKTNLLVGVLSFVFCTLFFSFSFFSSHGRMKHNPVFEILLLSVYLMLSLLICMFTNHETRPCSTPPGSCCVLAQTLVM